MHPQKRYTRYIAFGDSQSPARRDLRPDVGTARRSLTLGEYPGLFMGKPQKQTTFDAQHVPDLFFTCLPQSMIQSPDAGESGGESENPTQLNFEF